MTEETRPSPDALLREAEREGRGTLKIFLGAAPGVGKTYEMLLEGAEKRAALESAKGRPAHEAPINAVLTDAVVHWAE